MSKEPSNPAKCIQLNQRVYFSLVPRVSFKHLTSLWLDTKSFLRNTLLLSKCKCKSKQNTCTLFTVVTCIVHSLLLRHSSDFFFLRALLCLSFHWVAEIAIKVTEGTYATASLLAELAATAHQPTRKREHFSSFLFSLLSLSLSLSKTKGSLFVTFDWNTLRYSMVVFCCGGGGSSMRHWRWKVSYALSFSLPVVTLWRLGVNVSCQMISLIHWLVLSSPMQIQLYQARVIFFSPSIRPLNTRHWSNYADISCEMMRQ